VQPVRTPRRTAATSRHASLTRLWRSDTPLVPPIELPTRLSALPLWRLGADGKSIEKSFVARNFVAGTRARGALHATTLRAAEAPTRRGTTAVDYINALAVLAEAETHHPDVHLTSYRDVRVVLSTHAVGGLTLPDFILAAKIDALPWSDYSPKWLREQAAAQAAP